MASLYYLSQFFTTELAVVGGINASQTTDIVIQDITGIDDTSKPGVALLNYSDPLNESICEWMTFTNINSTTKEFEGVTRGAEKGSAKTHDNGVTVAFPISESHINNINDKLTGVDPIASPSLSGTVTGTYTLAGTPTITSPIINQFSTASGLGAAWTAFTPNLTNLTLGNGTLTCAYTQIGKTIIARYLVVLGNTSSVGGSIDFDLPVTAKAAAGEIFTGRILDASPSAIYYAFITLTSTSKVKIYVGNAAAASYLSWLDISATVPITWTTSDQIAFFITYEAA